MFKGLGSLGTLTSISTLRIQYVSGEGRALYTTIPIYLKIGDTVLINIYTRAGVFVTSLIGKIEKLYNPTGNDYPSILYYSRGNDGILYTSEGSSTNNYDPSILTTSGRLYQVPTTVELPTIAFYTELANQMAWISSLKQTGFTNQTIINIDNKLTTGITATSSEIDSVRTVFKNTAAISPTQIGVSIVIGISEQNGLPYPILGITVGISPTGNYLAQSGTNYYEFKSGIWQVYSTAADLEAKIADLQGKINNAKAALAAAQARLADLRAKAQALGISI